MSFALPPLLPPLLPPRSPPRSAPLRRPHVPHPVHLAIAGGLALATALASTAFAPAEALAKGNEGEAGKGAGKASASASASKKSAKGRKPKADKPKKDAVKAKAPPKPKKPKKPPTTCTPQKASPKLKRLGFVKNGMLVPSKHAEAVKLLATRYGHVETDSTKPFSEKAARSHSATVSFMGLPVTLHSKVGHNLKCVEKRIKAKCTSKKSRYTPRALSGFRDGNTYRGAEISNHLFGIAVDIDPERNPCCGCVDPWPSHPLCKIDAPSIYDRMELPKCWVDAFERYGFHWLGRDTLQDTMHFEFLGDPDK